MLGPVNEESAKLLPDRLEDGVPSILPIVEVVGSSIGDGQLLIRAVVGVRS